LNVPSDVTFDRVEEHFFRLRRFCQPGTNVVGIQTEVRVTVFTCGAQRSQKECSINAGQLIFGTGQHNLSTFDIRRVEGQIETQLLGRRPRE
jgi:hypothetical protein